MARAPRSVPQGASDLNPANLLTMLRILLVPVFVSLMLYRQWPWALAVYAVAALTDLVDGWLARRQGWVTALGIFIDPMADKLLQLSAVTLLAIQGYAPLWVAVLIWAREAVVVIGFAVLAMLGIRREVRSTWLGKGGTLAQMLGLALALAGPVWGWSGPAAQSVAAFLGAATLFNFAAGMEYAWNGFKAYDRRQP